MGTRLVQRTTIGVAPEKRPTMLPATDRGRSPYRPTLAEFERGTIDPEAFDHAAHVFVAWSYLREMPQRDAARAFCAALQRLTRLLGVAGKYHETISWFFLLLIAERRSGAAGTDWATFEAANPALLNDAGALLRAYYSPERLASPLARRQFLLPDRVPQHAAP